jgi:4-amino-4-deoxy-L-arabinose transferase-like glycosyltransferase
MILQTKHYRLLLLFIGIILFLPFLGAAPLFDWDEINFAESAREMLLTGNYSRVQINFQPFWEKPPLFFWMQALSMKIFGINEYAARFPNAFFGIITMLTLFEMGRKLRNNRFGFIWAMCMAGSFLPLVYFKSGIIDPVFNYFIFISVWFIAKTVQLYKTKEATKQALFAGIFIGLAILTKGPVGLLLAGLTVGVFWIYNRFQAIVSIKNIFVFGLSALLISLAWFGPETIQNGPWFLNEFITYQIRLFSTPDAGHAQPIYYHFVVVLVGCFPMSIIGIKSLFSKIEFRNNNPDFIVWMRILLGVVLILFSLVTTKIVHYSSMAYLPLSALAAMSIEHFIQAKSPWKVSRIVFLLLVGLPLGLAIFLIPIIGIHTDALVPFIKDAFAIENLKASIRWSYLDLIPGMIWISGLLIGAVLLIKNRMQLAFIVLFSSCIISTGIFLMSFPKRIAGYTQQAAVDFYSDLKGKDVYVETLRFKSFAQYFYFQKEGFSKLEGANCKDGSGYYHIDAIRNWYLNGEIDKPVYFVVKSIHVNEYESYTELEKMDEKNGFVLLRRSPKK